MPQSPRTRTTAGSIYAIGAVGSPYVKIGSTSTSVEQRLQTLQTAQPATLHIVAKQAVQTDVRRIERQIHKFLAAERHHGEWFALMLDAEALQELILRAVEYLAESDRQAALKAALDATTHSTPESLHLMAGSGSPFAAMLGQRIHALRRQRHLTQRELASLVGYTTHVAITHIESGMQGLTLEMTLRLASTLGVSLKELLGPFWCDEEHALAKPRRTTSTRQAHPHSQAPMPTRDTPQLAWEW